MKNKKIIGIFLCLILFGVSFSAPATDFSKTSSLKSIKIIEFTNYNQDRLMLVRIPYTEYNFNFISKYFEIVEYKLNEWIDIIINYDLCVNIKFQFIK